MPQLWVGTQKFPYHSLLLLFRGKLGYVAYVCVLPRLCQSYILFLLVELYFDSRALYDG